MNGRKCLIKGPILNTALIIVSVVVFMSHLPLSAGFLNIGGYELNCSQHCSCSEQSIDTLMREYLQKHAVVKGEKYRPIFDEGSSDYVDFLGMALTVLSKIVEVTCILGDGKPHMVSSLLNGIENTRYTSLEVKCRLNEELIWDVPTWEVSYNIFSSENCRLVPLDPSRGIGVPMNLWIMEVYGGGKELFNELNIQYAMNMVAFVFAESPSAVAVPESWSDKYMLSANTISMHNNDLKSFECRITFTKHLDTLNLGGNELVRFPGCLLNPDYVGITYLSLANNVISDILPLTDGQDKGKRPDIKIIDLSHNDIRSIDTFRDMPKLTTLDLSHNLIKTINNDVFCFLRNLEWLSLAHNRIVSMGNYAFENNINMLSIDLSHNAINNVVPTTFPPVKSSMDLDLRRNKLLYPPFNDCANKTLPQRNLRLLSAGNPFVCDCKAIEFEKCTRWIESLDGNGSSVSNVFADIKYLQCTGPKDTKGKTYTEFSFHTTCIVEDECPPGCACFIDKEINIIVNCSGQHLMEMPDSIPMNPKNNIVLYLDHNPLQMLSFRSYLRVLSELHIHNCLLTTVTPAAVTALQNVKVLTLHNNLLQKLPSSTRNITLKSASNVTLHNNRWACSCDNLWLPTWISKHRNVLWTPGRIVCSYLRKPVEEFSDLDINCANSSYLDVVLAACLGLSSIVSTLVIMFYYRTEINQLIYSKTGLRFCNTFNYGDVFSPYDAFVSYSQDNYKWIVDTLVPHLENGPKKYRLCLHFRDFPAGEPVVENIPWAIRLSRVSILILSRDFLAKEWVILELRSAFQRLLLMANRLIVIATEDILMDELTPDLRAYMSTHEYLRVGEPNFWNKLELYLPPPRFQNSDSGDDVAKQGAGGDEKKIEYKEWDSDPQSNRPVGEHNDMEGLEGMPESKRHVGEYDEWETTPHTNGMCRNPYEGATMQPQD